jgi:hypothetical protein
VSAPSPSVPPPSALSVMNAAPPHAATSADESPTVNLNAKRCPKVMFDSPPSDPISHARRALGYPWYRDRTAPADEGRAAAREEQCKRDCPHEAKLTSRPRSLRRLPSAGGTEDVAPCFSRE